MEAERPRVPELTGAERRQRFEETWARMGPMFWPELHHPRVAPDLAAEAAWMETFTDKIGCGECKTHWLEPLQTMPPKFASREAYFAWTVEAHNVVNRRLGKPLMSIGAAKELYA